MTASHSIRRVLPLAVSLGLLAWLGTRISPRAVLDAAGHVHWQALLPATAAMVLALYLWDSVCLPTVYRINDKRWGYARSLRLRGLSYLGGAWNYEVGQAALAWGMSRQQGTSVVLMVARSLLLAYHDIVVLLGLGLVGSLLSSDPRMERLRWGIAFGLMGASMLAFGAWAMPKKVRHFFKHGELALSGWNLRRSLALVPMRVVYFSILIIYAALSLRICSISVDGRVVFGAVPLVLLADALPSLAGLGTRETTLQMLLNPSQPEVLLAMSLIWSTGLILGRAAIGLAHLWWSQLYPDAH